MFAQAVVSTATHATAQEINVFVISSSSSRLNGPQMPPSRFMFETTSEGNSNSGHDYGTKLSAEQKRELMEYLKTL